ncbi:hypothetical protein TWF506_009564 [Arthrobotrys conoides]|uniref:T6SS Phospholipase effector Tle1-like catalytic domain-containing protein n=1 Tax=Arthrobotrys conoides TaxID=74498 RepID=A0AAN8NLE8_9PEZI
MSVRRIVSLFNQGQEYLNGGTNDTNDNDENPEIEASPESDNQIQEAETGSPAEGTLSPVKMVWRITKETPELPESDQLDKNTHDTNAIPTLSDWVPPESEPRFTMDTWTPTESQPRHTPVNGEGGPSQANGNGVGLNGNGAYSNGNGTYTNGNGSLYVNGNDKYANGNGIGQTNGNGTAHINGKDMSPSEEREEDIYARSSSLPRPTTKSAGNSQRLRAYATPSAPIVNPRPQRPPGIGEVPSFTRSEITPTEMVSKIPRLSGGFRSKIPNVTPDSLRSIPSVSTLPPYSPPQNPVQEPLECHETSNTLLNKEPQARTNDHSTVKFREIKQGPQQSLEHYLSTDLPFNYQTQTPNYGPIAWSAVDRSGLHCRAAITSDLPRINTDLPRMIYDGGSSIPEDTPSPADRIKDLEFEVGSLHETLKTTKEQLKKEAANSLSPTAGVDRLYEYLKPDEGEASSSKKVSPIQVAPFIRAKKLILILDATNSGTIRPMSNGKLYPETQTPRTVLKRISDCLTAEHKGTRKRQQVFYLSGCGTGEEFGLNKSLHTTILDAYTYLSDNWEPGDELFLFGFSRGAFAIRAIAALITEIGLLNKAGMTHFETLYDSYFDPRYGKCRSTDEYEKWRAQCTSLAWNLGQLEGITITKVPVKFLGCLETIGWSNYERQPSKTGHDAKKLWEKGVFDFRHLLLHEAVEKAFHALALDEDRYTHSPLLMFRPRNSIKQLTQVWFTGSHVNIGGGQLILEAEKNVANPTPDQNELSDIVFLFLITECHEFLSFSKTYVNKGVSDYMSQQSTANVIKDIHFKNHWISARIDEIGSDSGNVNVFSRIRKATGNRKKHIRTPLRYRPHWFDWEPWNRYKSCEAIHGSSQYRTKHYPDYVPKALLEYRCAKTFERFGVGHDPSAKVPGEESVLRYSAPKTCEEKFYYVGQEDDEDKKKKKKKKDRMHPNNMALPIIKLSAFEVLLSGGETLIFGFGLAFKDIYRESPPVFQYSFNELTGMREDWILRVETQPPRRELSPTSMADRTIALRNAQSVPTSLKYQHYVIRRESPYSSARPNSGAPLAARQRPVSAAARLASTQGNSSSTQEKPPPLPPRRSDLTQSAPNLRDPAATERRTPFSYTSTPQLEDESGTGKGKGRHSIHTNNLEGGDRGIGSSQGPRGYDGTDEREPGQEGNVNPEPKEQKSKMGSIRKFFSFASLRGKKKDSEASNSRSQRPGIGQIDGQTENNTDGPAEPPSDLQRAELEARERAEAEREHQAWLVTFDRSKLVLPDIEEPEWRKILRQGNGAVQPCKFKHQHSHGGHGHGHNHGHSHQQDQNQQDQNQQDQSGQDQNQNHDDENDGDLESYGCGHMYGRESGTE